MMTMMTVHGVRWEGAGGYEINAYPLQRQRGQNTPYDQSPLTRTVLVSDYHDTHTVLCGLLGFIANRQTDRQPMLEGLATQDLPPPE